MQGLLNPWTMMGAGLLSTSGQMNPANATFGAGLSRGLGGLLDLEQFNMQRGQVEQDALLQNEKLKLLRSQFEQEQAQKGQAQQAIQGLLSQVQDPAKRAQIANLFQVDPKAAIGLLTAKPEAVEKWSEPYLDNSTGKPILVQRNETTGALKAVGSGGVTVNNAIGGSPYKPETATGKLASDIAYWESQPDSPLKQETIDSLYRKRRMEGRTGENVRADDRMTAAADIADNFNKIAEEAADSTGPIAGTITRAKLDDGMIGRVIRAFSDPTTREAQLTSMEAQMKAMLGTALSGAAIPATEWPTYQAQLPSVVDGAKTRKAKAETFRTMIGILKKIQSGDATREDLDAAINGGAKPAPVKVLKFGQR